MANASLCRKSKCFSLLVAAFFLQGAVFARTVTIDPGNGIATNVQQRITGATDVVVATLGICIAYLFALGLFASPRKSLAE